MTTHRTRPLFGYIVGFILSLLLTLLSFSLSYTMSAFVVPLIVLAACIQIFVQVTFFLHLGSKATPASWTVFFGIALLIIGILVGGTLWIMHNLNRLHMLPVTNNTLYEHGQAAPQNEKY